MLQPIISAFSTSLDVKHSPRIIREKPLIFNHQNVSSRTWDILSDILLIILDLAIFYQKMDQLCRVEDQLVSLYSTRTETKMFIFTQATLKMMQMFQVLWNSLSGSLIQKNVSVPLR